MAYIKISRKNFFHNLNQIALKTGSIDKIAVVLKDNAYGHGLEIMAKLAQEYGIKEAVVISKEEAQAIKVYFDNVLILNAKPFVDECFSFAVTDIKKLEKIDNQAKIELKIDTGMHRNGISMDELDDALDIIREKDLNLTGVMTHYRSADVLSSELAWQQHNFRQIKLRVIEAGYTKVRFHSHNSATILRCKSFDEDVVRLGIGGYGYNELPAVYDKLTLEPIMSLWATKASTRKLKSGQRVGYGGDFVAHREMSVSTYDLGYGDGWFRGSSLTPYTTPEGLPILGRVSMDFVSLESSTDELCIMNDAQAAGKHFATISYEITTALSASIKRVIVD